MVTIVEFNTVIYDVSSPCDYRCIYCRNDWNDLKNFNHSDIKHVKKILTKFKENNFSRVVYTGGEFFNIPYWKEILKFTKHLGIDVWIITNGYSISKKDIGLLESHVSRINISFHAPNAELYNEIMRPPSKKALVKVLDNMKTIGDSNIDLGIFYSPIKMNFNLLYETIKKLNEKKIKIKDINVNRIVQTQSTQQFFNKQKPLNLFEHKKLVQQVVRINEELQIRSFLEGYPLCFISSFIEDKEKLISINQPCYLGRIAIAFNVDGSIKLCPATQFSISDSIVDKNIVDKNKVIEKFNNRNWRHKKCQNCSFWKNCFGGCHAAKGELFANDPLLIDDEVEFVENIDPVFFNILLNLYEPFLSASYKKADIQYTVFSKNKFVYPIGIIALNKTNAGGKFLEIALIPEFKGGYYSFLIINKFIKLHSFKKIGWTAHKANLPSIKLLKKLNGGFFEKTVKNKRRIEAEGFFRLNNNVSKKMKDSLHSLIPESEMKFKDWLNEYNTRKKELRILDNFLKGYKNENN
jgi:radical SAM protein with 4Fe4S-binding SPASM domain